ncbi:MAG: hypothetical protein H7249_19605 [Chitinophagaceae bacterium]|nr:hypothetical protein [Oligoflexus sp.]
MFGTQTDPVPYMAAAYGIGIFVLLAYSGWQLSLRKKLRALEIAVHEGATNR